MRYDLAALIRRQRNPRRSQIILRPILPPATLAGDLYAAGYKPIITAWERAVDRIAAEYARSLPINDSAPGIHATIHDSIFDIEGILSSLGDELSRLVLTLTPALRDWAVRVERYHSGRWRGAILTASGVDISMMLMASGQPQSVGETVAWNASLVRNVNDDTRAKIGSATFAAFQARKPARELAGELRDIVGASRRRALNIASDQLSKLSSALDKERQLDAGLDKFKYRSSHKLHARKWHAARDGKLYELVSGKQVGGDDVIEVGDEPGQPPYCGCRRQGVIDLS